MELVAFTFQGVDINGAHTLIPWVSNVINHCHNSKKSYYVGYVRKATPNVREVKRVSIIYQMIDKFVSVLGKHLLHIKSYKIRFFLEKTFDYFASHHITKPSIIISTALLYKTLNKNRSLGGISILLLGNPDDLDINKIYLEEQRKYNIQFDDAYTYKPRIDFFVRSTELFDSIIVTTKVSYNSIIKRIDQEKVFLCEKFWLPNKFLFPVIDMPKSNILNFCFVFNAFWLKGYSYLFDAWTRVCSKRDNILLTVVGEMDSFMVDFVKSRYPNISNILFVGPTNDVNHYYRTADVCIVPSLLDANPRVVTEAMYCGLPVIISDGCGNSTIIKNGYNGFVIPAFNSEAIQERIVWFIEHQQEISLMGLNAHSTIDNIDVDAQDCNLAKLINLITND